MTRQKKEVVLLLTHKINEKVKSNYVKIRKGFEKIGPVLYLLHDETGHLLESVDAPVFSFTYKEIMTMGFNMISDKLVPGSNHFPLILFSNKFPDYSHYWIIEFDVDFNGDWEIFFDDFSEKKEDFYSCHLRMQEEEPDWPWWGLSHPEKIIPIESRIRSFNTIYRISSTALNFINESLKDKWTGHHEVLLPTLLHNNQFTVRDFGGSGKFVNKGYENMYYTSNPSNPKGILFSGSMRYRPCIGAFKEGINKLYHPCK